MNMAQTSIPLVEEVTLGDVSVSMSCFSAAEVVSTLSVESGSPDW